MGHRQKIWARKAYDKLIQELGAACYHCGSTENLTVDHIAGKDYVANKLEWSARVSRYRREMKEGKLQVLCNTCNVMKGNSDRCRPRKEHAQ